jgi:GNAT superfamily N-acetyltransferase
MKLLSLDKDKIEYIYKNRMILDFPADEIKPLNTILRGIDNGIYECLGMYDEDELMGYAFLIRAEKNYLLDYLAVFSEKRNGGIGSEILRLLLEYLHDARMITVEAEDPEFADNDADRELRSRRIGFYKRNGYSDTGLRVECFGVSYVVLQTGVEERRDKQWYWDIYRSYYRILLTEELYRNNIKSLNI